MKVEKLGDNLYRISIGFFRWDYSKYLSEAILQIQGEGKIITAIATINSSRGIYLICTSEARK